MDALAILALAAGAATAVAAWLILGAGARDRTLLERALGVTSMRRDRTRLSPPTVAEVVAAAGGLVPPEPFDTLGGRLVDPATDAERRLVRGIGLVLGVFVLLLAVANPLWAGAILVVPLMARGVVERRRREVLREHQRAVEGDVTTAVDVFVLALEAGLPFDRALTAYTDTTRSALATELSATVRELEVGYRRREAIERLVARTRSAGLAALERTLRLAEDFGTPLADALRALAADLRSQRRQRLQEAALRAPVTMLLPTAGFILLPIFAIILGPIALRVATGTLF